MALDVHKAGGLGLLAELLVQVRVARDEGDVHHGAVLLAHGVLEQAGLVQVVVEHGRLALVVLLHLGEAAVGQEPLEGQAGHVDAKAGGRVVHRVVGGHGVVLEHGGGDVQRVADEVLAHDDDGHACRGHVLLGTGQDEPVAGHVGGLGEDAGGHVRHQGHLAGVGQGGEAGAVDGVVLADIEVIGVGPERGLVPVGDVGVAVLAGGGHHLDVAVALGFLDGQVGEVAGVDVVGLAALVGGEQVQGHLGKLHGGAALQEEHLVVVRNGHQGAQVRLGLLNDVLEHLGAMAHLRNAHASIAVADEILLRLFQHGKGQGGGAGRKIIHAVHAHGFLLYAGRVARRRAGVDAKMCFLL